MDPSLGLDGAPVFVGALILVGLFIGLVVTVVQALIFCKIFAKAGYHWALGLLILVPLANLVVPFFLAFADWPAQRELRELRQRTGAPETPNHW